MMIPQTPNATAKIEMTVISASSFQSRFIVLVLVHILSRDLQNALHL